MTALLGAVCVQLRTVPAQWSLPAYRRAPTNSQSVRLACLCSKSGAIRAVSTQLQHLGDGKWVLDSGLTVTTATTNTIFGKYMIQAPYKSETLGLTANIYYVAIVVVGHGTAVL